MSHGSHEKDSGHQQPERLVRFGSLIHLNLEDNFQYYMYGEGFMNQRVEMKKFELQGEVNKDNDFSYCLFMILPFQDLNSFSLQQNLLEYFTEDKNSTKKLGDEKKLEERKEKINDFKNKLESEYQYNISTMERQCGQKILLINSNFMLLHMNTMKFVCLNKENSENLYVELVEYPNNFCFFKFMPSLLLQTMRNDNFVYENELMHICCSEMIDGKRPYLMAEVEVPTQVKTLNNQKNNMSEQHLVYASIDNAKSWKLNLYQEPVVNSEMESLEEMNYLRAGDIVWIVQTEKKLFISSSRQNDPFVQIIQNKQNKKENMTEEDQVKLIKHELLDSFKTEFQNIDDPNIEKTSNHQELSTNGLYRIEPIDLFTGGPLQWGHKYRIRHLISGKYLCCQKKGASRHKQKYYLRLTKKREDNTLFKFIPIENLMYKYQSKQNIQKDSFFRIQHTCSEEIVWLGAKEEEEGDISNPDGNNQIIENQALFEQKLRDINTFKFRKSSQQDIWETNFLQSSISEILKLAQNIVDVSELDNFKNQNSKFNVFDTQYPKAINTIKSLEDFITNKIISNISMNHEYNYPSLDRQNKFCEQMLLGLFCWFLIKVFPKPEEFEAFGLKANDSLLKEDSDPTKSEKSSNFKGREKMFRQCVMHLKNKYTLSYQIYRLIKYACYRNPTNQYYFFLFCQDMIEHVGYGDFVKESFQFCFQGNFQILQSLHQIHFKKKAPITNQANGNEQQGKEKKSRNFFQHLVKRLKIMEPYTKNDILSLLASFCVINNNTIYINQEKIFQSFIDNRQIIFNTLLKIREEVVENNFEITPQEENNIIDQRIYQKKKNFFIEIRKKTKKKLEYEIAKHNLTKFDETNIKKNNKPNSRGYYFLCQVDLYSNMCANRNFTCGKAFSDIFPKHTLMTFIEDDNHSTELRARMSRLQRNLYIDKEPRLVIQKPNLVRIFKSQKDRSEDKEIGSLIFDPVILKMIRHPELKKKKENINYLALHRKKFEKYLKKENETDIYVKFIKNNAKEDSDYIQNIRLFIKRQLKKSFKQIMLLKNMQIEEKQYPDYFAEKEIKQKQQSFKETSNEKIYNNVYNSLTFEVIKSFHLMLKFGLFTEYAGKDNPVKDNSGKDNSGKEDADKNDPGKINKRIFKDIISYLSFILEFEIDYTSELTNNGLENNTNTCLQRKYIKNIDKQIEEKQSENFSFNAIKNIGGDSMKLFTDMAKLVPLNMGQNNDDDVEEEIVRGSSYEIEGQESMSFLNTYQSLLKLISKYTNKTYKKKNLEIEINKDLETLIKIEICEIFEYIMDWREDFFIQNAMNFFTDKFYQNNLNPQTVWKQEDLEKEVAELLPENTFAVGQAVLTKKRKFKQFKLNPKDKLFIDHNLYTEQVENIDDIIRRPFIESLMIGFYFAEDPDLQNKLSNLIYRSFNQKKKLLDNINKINLVDSGNSDSSYQQMSKLISRLKALISYSQSWLQIIEQNVYNEKAEENLDITLKKLTKLYEQFSNKSKNQELEIKQKIFKHLEGHKVLLKFLEQGTGVLQSNSHYFSAQYSDLQEYSYKKQFMQNIISVFQMCHKILSIFCLKNKSIQKTLFKHYNKLLYNQSYLNLGQVEFICSIFKANKELSVAYNSSYLDYMIGLIKIHGKQPEFLELFWILIQNYTQENNEVQKKVIQCLLDSKTINSINPFYDENIAEDNRKSSENENMQKALKSQRTRLVDVPAVQTMNNFSLYDIRQQGTMIDFDYQDDQNEQQFKKFDIDLTIKFFPECQDEKEDVKKRRLREYKLKLIEVIAIGFNTSDIGINFVYRSFLHIRVSSLFKILLEEMKSKSKKHHDDKNVNANKEHLRKQYITDLLLTYFSKLDQSISHFQKCSQTFVSCVQCEIDNIKSKHEYNHLEKIFIIDNFLPIINEYNDNFLKDSVLLAIQQRENSIDAQNQSRILEFARVFLKEINNFIDLTQFKKLDNKAMSKLKNIAILANNFRINPPSSEVLQELINNMSIENKEGSTSQTKTITKKTQNETKRLTGKTFSKFKNVVTAIIFQRRMKKGIKENKANGNSLTDDTENKLKKIADESRYLKLWTQFKNILSDSKLVKDQVKDEHRLFKDSIMQFDNFIENKKDALEDLLISKEDIIKKFLSFIRFWKEMGSSKGSVIFILKTLRHIIERSENQTNQTEDSVFSLVGPSGPSQKQAQEQGDPESMKEKRQNIMDGLNTTIICTTLLMNEGTKDKKYLYYLFRLLISLLDGGNTQVQHTIYQFFICNSESEYFFQKIYHIIEDEIRLIKKFDGKKTSFGSDKTSQKPLIENVLRLIQLLCEGHNSEMQNYMRNQISSKINYDLVSKIVELLVSIKVSNETYQSVKQCFDTLTEIVQGPCKLNQVQILSTKFLEYAVDILRGEENVYVITQSIEKISDPAEKPLTKKEKQKKEKEMKQQAEKKKVNNTEYEMIEQPEQKEQKIEKIAQKFQTKQKTHQVIRKKQAHKGYIVRIKHKCLITLLSLLELNESDLSIVNRIRRTIPLQVLINQMVEIHQKYEQKYKQEYFRECFNQAENDEKIDFKEEKIDDEIIIELGFNSFFLINIFLSSLSKNQLDSEYQEVYQLIRENQSVEEEDENKDNSILSNLKVFKNLTQSIVGGSFEFMKKVGQTAVNLGSDSENQKILEQLKKEQDEKDNQKKKQEAIKFFSEKSLHIEILRDNKLSKVYFPKLPFFSLPKEYKVEFHEEVDYNSDKGKLRTLIESSKKLINIMNHEEDCRELFRKFSIVGFIAEHKFLWENLAFCCNCLLNSIIIASYGVYESKQKQMKFDCLNDVCDYKSDLQHERMYEPRLFGIESYDWTKSLLSSLGIVNLVLSSLIFFFFFIKRAPILLKEMWMKWYEEKIGLVKKFFKLIWVILDTIKTCCTDFDFMYYTLYMGFCVVGLVIHPFFFGFLTVDFLRIKILKNVVKAVWIPRVDMALTFMIFLLCEFYYTLISYLLLYDQYTNDDRYGTCDVLWKCLIYNFDWTFKETGSLGGFLDDKTYSSDVKQLQPIVDEGNVKMMNFRYLGRFFFDNSFMIIQVILLINMSAGIIIENFSALKDEQKEKDEALVRKCFVCGIDRELIEKAYDDLQYKKGFKHHIRFDFQFICMQQIYNQRDHYMWDYVYFSAYLQYKDQKEFSGNESYVNDQFKTTDVSWFPVKRAINVQDEETKLKIERKHKIHVIEKHNQALQEKLEALRLKVNVVKTEMV